MMNHNLGRIIIIGSIYSLFAVWVMMGWIALATISYQLFGNILAFISIIFNGVLIILIPFILLYSYEKQLSAVERRIKKLNASQKHCFNCGSDLSEIDKLPTHPNNVCPNCKTFIDLEVKLLPY